MKWMSGCNYYGSHQVLGDDREFKTWSRKKKWMNCRLAIYVMCSQGCILLTYLSVISSKFIQKVAQKCQYFTSIDQSVPLYNFYITFYLRTNQLCVGATWCHLEPSYVPYSLNQLFGWDFFCFFLQQNRSSLLQASPRGWELPDSCSRKANAGSLICSMNQRLSYNLDISYYLSFNFIPSFFYMTFSIFFAKNVVLKC